jgi:hypothetical protein
MPTKAKSRKLTNGGIIWKDTRWNVVAGELKRARGRPAAIKSLFLAVAEKLPFDSIDEVQRTLKKWGIGLEGVYLAHDSMGVARYGGRGRIFNRLKSHKKKYRDELFYFSFYIIKNKNHEREVENVILRTAGTQLSFNQRKVREGIERGNVADYEAGTCFFERQGRRGKKRQVRRGRPRRRLPV